MSAAVHSKTAPEDVIPLGQKVAFGFGGLANQLFTAALGIFMVVLVMGLKMDPVLAGILAAIPRLWDAVADPIMGYISDNTKSRWGRRRPYILVGAIITGLSFIFMWQIYPENSQLYNFWYFLLGSLAFYLGYTIFAAPYVALGYEMSSDFHERTRLMAVSQWIGQFAWVIAPWFWVIIYNQAIYPTPAEGARNLSIWVGLFCMALGVIPSFFCKQRAVTGAVEDSHMSVSGIAQNLKKLFLGIKQTVNCIPFIKLCGATFLIFNGFQTVAQFSFFIIVYYIFNGSFGDAGQWPAWFGTISALATAFLVIPIVTFISQKTGKKNAFVISTVISMIGYSLKWICFNPTNPWLMFLPLPLISFGIGGLFTLMMSMTADVCDLDELNNGSRREGTFGAVYWWMVKMGTALAMFTSGVVLKWAGFDQTISVQPLATMTKLRIADILVPVLTALLAIIIMWTYNITEEKAGDIRKQLEARRGKV